ncbi:hypothetical protein JVT61DRAFT_6912 [Boletus reticuloceps]|uniref:Uncharacterized protein n=1 Tax=Boletus reticuloceps TaxID=495285 RepID=A0A8I3A7E8_9AGAM|nr:hypothetical protein JVT61DRAFT_6912 [Boletus reticuloceps]
MTPEYSHEVQVLSTRVFAPPQPSNLSHYSSARDSTQPHCHVSNIERLQEHALPSPSISRSNSNRGDEHNYDNGTQVPCAVCCGDKHVRQYNMPCVILNMT